MPKDFRADLDNRPKVVRDIGLFNLHYLRLPSQVSDHEIVVVCMRCPGVVLLPLRMTIAALYCILHGELLPLWPYVPQTHALVRRFLA